MEKNLKLVTILGVKEQLRKGSKTLVRNLNKAGIKTWMLSGDSFIKCKDIGLRTGILPHKR